MAKIHGCYYCFQTLDPHDSADGRKTFVKCRQCRRLYHESCWNLSEGCLFCRNQQATPFHIAEPPLLTVRSRKRAVLIKPSAILYLWNNEVVECGTEKVDYHLYGKVLDKLIQSVLLATVVAALVALIGAYFSPLLQLGQQGNLNVESVMQVLFDGPFPSEKSLVTAFVASVIMAFVFYQPFHSEHSANQHELSLNVWLLAGVISLFLIDIALFDISLPEIMDPESILSIHKDFFLTQGVTSLLIILIIPIYQRVAPSIPSLNYLCSPLAKEIYGWARLLIVSLVCIWIVSHLSTTILLSLPEEYELWRISLAETRIELGPFVLVSVLISIIIATFFYRAPAFRRLREPYGTWRLVLLILCVIAIALVWRDFPGDRENLFVLGGVTLALSLLLIPVQRVLS